jgi:hypothetical protein
MRPLSERENRAAIERDHVDPEASPHAVSAAAEDLLDDVAERVRAARANDRPVVIAFGAHTIKNGLGPVLNALMEEGRLTHLATNGAGIIHDWEFSFLGESSEHVEKNVEAGSFGNWEETGYYINLALNIGAWRGLGYGESVGALIEEEGLPIPSEAELRGFVDQGLRDDPERCAAAADLLGIMEAYPLDPGKLKVPHPWKRFSAQATAYRLGIPFTGHPMIGHDIIYNHPMNHGGSLGRTAIRDFLTYADSISRIDGGVYISVGSAVMSPMIFEKSLSMAQNLAKNQGASIRDHFILVVDLAESAWDWTRGEPPEDDPSYYLRYNKSFSRMGGTMKYLQMDNRDFLLHLRRRLGGE